MTEQVYTRQSQYRDAIHDKKKRLNTAAGRVTGRDGHRGGSGNRARHDSLHNVVHLAAQPDQHCGGIGSGGAAVAADAAVGSSGVQAAASPSVSDASTQRRWPKQRQPLLPLQQQQQQQLLLLQGHHNGNYSNGGSGSSSSGGSSVVASRLLPTADQRPPDSPEIGSSRADSRSRALRSRSRPRAAAATALDDPDSELGIAITKSLDGADLARALRSARSSAVHEIVTAASAVTAVSAAGEDTAGAKSKSKLEGLLSSTVLSLAQKARPAAFKVARKKLDRRASEGLVLEWSDNWGRRDSDGLMSEPLPGETAQAEDDDDDKVAAVAVAPALRSSRNVSGAWDKPATADALHPSQRSDQRQPRAAARRGLTAAAGKPGSWELSTVAKEGRADAAATNSTEGPQQPTGMRSRSSGQPDRNGLRGNRRRGSLAIAGTTTTDSSSEGEASETLLTVAEMEDHEEILRIEKLFPNDDLDLAATTPPSANQKSTSKWQAAVIKTLKRVQAGTAAAGTGAASAAAPAAEKPVLQSSYITRKFLLESYAQLTVGLQTQERYLFLFNDVLFIAKQRPSAAGYKLKRRVQVSDMWITDVISDVSEATHCDPKRSFVIGWPVTNVVSTFESVHVMQQWKAQLLMVMNNEKSKESSSITVDIHYRDAQSSTSRTVAINVSRSMAASECMCKAMEVLGFEVCNAGNYQLWVTSSRENAAYPLFGHEEVFAIQMSHQRGYEQNHDVKCQFILKEKKKPERLADRKPAKSRMMLDIGALFRKNTSKQQLTSPSSSKDFTRGKLFGQPLSQISGDGLPKALEELLENLFNVAPFTCEIFRKPSTARECQEVVSKMNVDDQVCWPNYRRNGLLMASVLKSFLRELPNRLLHFELYSDWSDSTRISDKHDRIAKHQNLISRLDEREREVLKRVVCILHHVRERAETNRMTSYNLAVCLGPSLLWPPHSGKHDLNEASKLVPDVVQFMLDNCTEIFGKDELLLAFGRAPCPPPDDDASDRGEDDDEEEEGEVAEEDDAMRSLRTQCSESLESISDTDVPGALEQMSPSSRSRDSGLILNDAPEDCDQSDENLARGGADDSLRSKIDGRRSVIIADATATSVPTAGGKLLDKSRSHGSLASVGDIATPLEAKYSAHGSGVVPPGKGPAQQRARRPSGLGARTRRVQRTLHHEESCASACSSESPSGAGADDDTPPSPCHRSSGTLSFHCPSPAVLTKSSSGGHLCFDAMATSEASIERQAAGLQQRRPLADLAEQSGKYAESAPSLLNHRELSLSATLTLTGATCKSLSSASTSSSSSPAASDDDVRCSEGDAAAARDARAQRAAPATGRLPLAAAGESSRSSAQIRRRSLVEPQRHRGKGGPAFAAVSRPRRGLPKRSVSVGENYLGKPWSDAAAEPEAAESAADPAAGDRADTQAAAAAGLSAASQADRLVELVIEAAAAATASQHDGRPQERPRCSSSSKSAAAAAAATEASAGLVPVSGLGPIFGEEAPSRPRLPPPYDEAVHRHELNAAGVTEIERLKQTVMSARAKQLYDRSVQMFEKEQQTTTIVPPLQQRCGLRSSSSRSSLNEGCSEGEAVGAAESRPLAAGAAARGTSNGSNGSGGASAAAAASERLQGRAVAVATSPVGTSPALLRKLADSTVVTTRDRTVIIRRSPVTRASASMFYQPGSEVRAGVGFEAAAVPRPANPPPYTEALSVQQRSSGKRHGTESDLCLPPESLV